MKIPDNARLITGVVFQANRQRMLLLFAIKLKKIYNNKLLYQIDSENGQTIIVNYQQNACQSYTWQWPTYLTFLCS